VTERIQFSDVRFSYVADVDVLRGVHLSIAAGENVAIVGQNGAGKTTLVKMMNGILKPTSGGVTVNGKDTKEHSTASIARIVGYVYQNPDDQIFNNTVYKEIAYAPKYHRYSSEEVDRNVHEAADLCGVSAFLTQNPYDLPLSVRKLVGMASVLALKPNYIVLDEPTAGQDTHGLRAIAGVVEELKNDGKGVVTITHDMDFAARNFSRVIAMAAGAIQYDGAVAGLFSQRDILERCRLSPPVAAQLAAATEFGDDVVTTDDFIRKAHALASR
jgi:energy-coupling factor transport system ATP-binding protein